MKFDRKASESELYRRCDEVLHYLWDPIGISNFPGARDEYHSYLPKIFLLVQGQSSVEEIVAYMHECEKRMGVKSNPAKSAAIAELLIEWRDWIRMRESGN